MAVPAGAAAEGGPASAVSQYVEMIPTGGGSQPVGVGLANRAPLAAAAEKALATIDPSTANILTEIATSSAYGAPAISDAKASTRTRQAATGSTVTGEGADKAAIAMIPVSGGSAESLVRDSTVIVLVGLLGAISLAMILAVVVGGRRDRSQHETRSIY